MNVTQMSPLTNILVANVAPLWIRVVSTMYLVVALWSQGLIGGLLSNQRKKRGNGPVGQKLPTVVFVEKKAWLYLNPSWRGIYRWMAGLLLSQVTKVVLLLEVLPFRGFNPDWMKKGGKSFQNEGGDGEHEREAEHHVVLSQWIWRDR